MRVAAVTKPLQAVTSRYKRAEVPKTGEPELRGQERKLKEKGSPGTKEFPWGELPMGGGKMPYTMTRCDE